MSEPSEGHETHPDSAEGAPEDNAPEDAVSMQSATAVAAAPDSATGSRWRDSAPLIIALVVAGALFVAFVAFGAGWTARGFASGHPRLAAHPAIGQDARTDGFGRGDMRSFDGCPGEDQDGTRPFGRMAVPDGSMRGFQHPEIDPDDGDWTPPRGQQRELPEGHPGDGSGPPWMQPEEDA